MNYLNVRTLLVIKSQIIICLYIYISQIIFLYIGFLKIIF